MLLISRPPPPKRAPQAMSIHSESSTSVSRAHVLNSGYLPNHGQGHRSPARRQYIRPALRIDCPPTPSHWDLASGDSNLDVREEDGYVLTANGEESTSGAFVPCEPLSAVRRARPGRLRLRIKPMVLHRRRIFGITTSPISPTAVSASSPSHLIFILTYLPITLLQLNDQFPLSSLPPLAFFSVIAFPRP